MNSLSIEQLGLTYRNGVQALSGIDLKISNGMFGLLGPNGAGKSSLMKCIVGLLQPSQGSISFNGSPIKQDPDAIRKYLGYLPQDFSVYPRVTAYQLLNHIACLKGLSDARARRQQIDLLLHKVNLFEARNKEVLTFSGGMRQRFGVAQALLGSPKIMIVDEPTAGLDPSERSRFNFLLNEISKDVIVLLSTHLVEDVRNLCPAMAILASGRIVKQGRPADLIRQLDGKLWSARIPLSDLQRYEDQFQLVSKDLREGELQVTVYAESPVAGFTAQKPTLDHVYFKALDQETKR